MYYKKPSKVNTFSNWRDLNWSGLYHECMEQHALVESNAKNLLEEEYARAVRQKEAAHEAMNPEGGSYEGDVSEELVRPVLDHHKLFKEKIRSTGNILESFIELNHIKMSAHHLVAEILKHISTYPLYNMADELYDTASVNIEYDEYGVPVPTEGLVSPAHLYRKVFTDDTMRGIYQFLMTDSRSSYLDKQYLPPSRNFCALVPLIMYAFKLHKGVPYEHWSRKSIVGIINPKLYDAMTWIPEEPFSKAEILEAREEGLLIKSGKQVGTRRNPTYTFKLYGAAMFKGVPELTQVMLSQIWCAHPDNRTKYMVLDPVKWDNLPTPLIDQDVLHKAPKTVMPYSKEDMPWL